MIRFFLLFVFFLLGSPNFILANQFEGAMREEWSLLDFESTYFDAGTLFCNDKSNPFFVFVNRTNESVKISEIIQDDSRYDMHFLMTNFNTDIIIRPGDSDTIHFSRRNAYATIKPGVYDLNWIIHFQNSPVQQTLTIHYNFIENKGDLECDTLRLPIVNLGSIIDTCATLKNNGVDTVTIWPPSDHKFTNYLDSYPIKIAPQSSRKLNFQINTETFSNRYDLSINFESNLQKTSNVRIPIKGEVNAPNRPDIYFNTLSQRRDVMQNGDGRFIFKYTNTGDQPLIISMCKSSCGCVVPSCKREPLAPGETEEILVRYDTKRIGPFRKTVTVYSNAVISTIVLRINGNVTRIPNGEIPLNVIANRSTASFYNFEQYVNYRYNEDNEAFFYFFNRGEDSLKIIETLAYGDIEVRHPENTIPPGEKGYIAVKYDTKIIGPFNRHITVISNGAPYTNILELKGIVRPEWDSLELGPIMNFDRVLIDTVFEQDVDATCKFSFTNSGDQPLMISNAKSSVPITSYPDTPILPGERGVITVKYEALNMLPFDFSIIIKSNDSQKPQRTLRVKGQLIPKPPKSNKESPIVPAVHHPRKNDLATGKDESIQNSDQLQFTTTLIERNYAKNDLIKIEFNYINTGEPVKILRVTDGNFGTMSYTKSSISKLEKGVITCTYQTSSTGPFERTIFVFHSGSDQPIILKVKGVIF